MQAEGQGARAPPDVLCLRIAANPHSVRDGLRQAMLWAAPYLHSEEARGAAEIVLAEVLNNIVEHAYSGGISLGNAESPFPLPLLGAPAVQMQSGADEAVCLILSPSATGLICLVEDRGARMHGMGPNASAAPDPADLPEGGYGWPLIRALCQDLDYERVGALNRLRFTLPARQSEGCDAIV